MSPSNRCFDLIKAHEGCVLKAYPDPGTGGEPWTIGYGHTGPEVHPGLVWTQDQAEAVLDDDVDNVASGVTRLLNVSVTQDQFDALVSFAFNVGLGNLVHSTLLTKINLGDYDGAAKEFQRWTHANGKVLPGLVARRNDEMDLFNGVA